MKWMLLDVPREARVIRTWGRLRFIILWCEHRKDRTWIIAACKIGWPIFLTIYVSLGVCIDLIHSEVTKHFVSPGNIVLWCAHHALLVNPIETFHSSLHMPHIVGVLNFHKLFHTHCKILAHGLPFPFMNFLFRFHFKIKWNFMKVEDSPWIRILQ